MPLDTGVQGPYYRVGGEKMKEEGLVKPVT